MTDLERRLSRLDPGGARPPVLPTADVSYALHDTPIGTLLLATAGGRVVASSFGDEETMTNRLARAISPRVLRQPAALDEVRRQVDEYLTGQRKAFELPVDLVLGNAIPAPCPHRSTGPHQLWPDDDLRAGRGGDRPAQGSTRGRYCPGRESLVCGDSLPPGDRLERRPHGVRRWPGRETLPAKPRIEKLTFPAVTPGHLHCP